MMVRGRGRMKMQGGCGDDERCGYWEFVREGTDLK